MHITKERESHQYNRRSVRLKGYDYGADGLYFVTLCCQHRHRATANMRATASVAPTLPCVIAAYKSLVSNACLNIYKSRNDIMGKLWQRNYYEHIIRNEYSYQIISEYIITNPARWKYNDSLTKTQ